MARSSLSGTLWECLSESFSTASRLGIINNKLRPALAPLQTKICSRRSEAHTLITESQIIFKRCYHLKKTHCMERTLYKIAILYQNTLLPCFSVVAYFDPPTPFSQSD